MRLQLAVLAVAGLLLSGCAHQAGPEAKVTTTVREVPVPVPCKADIGPDPAYPDTDAALNGVTDVFEGVKILKAGRTLRIARLSELADALKGCESAQ